ncbi:MAG: hypothetical protein HGA27_00430 [Peptococcaceae bacterium]|nr:hypothetical protein [Peptococcaceae bacterium]
MSLPCKCFKCARCIQLVTRIDPQCLAVEAVGCAGKDCEKCDIECERFIETQV